MWGNKQQMCQDTTPSIGALFRQLRQLPCPAKGGGGRGQGSRSAMCCCCWRGAFQPLLAAGSRAGNAGWCASTRQLLFRMSIALNVTEPADCIIQNMKVFPLEGTLLWLSTFAQPHKPCTECRESLVGACACLQPCESQPSLCFVQS